MTNFYEIHTFQLSSADADRRTLTSKSGSDRKARMRAISSSSVKSTENVVRALGRKNSLNSKLKRNMLVVAIGQYRASGRTVSIPTCVEAGNRTLSVQHLGNR